MRVFGYLYLMDVVICAISLVLDVKNFAGHYVKLPWTVNAHIKARSKVIWWCLVVCMQCQVGPGFARREWHGDLKVVEVVLLHPRRKCVVWVWWNVIDIIVCLLVVLYYWHCFLENWAPWGIGWCCCGCPGSSCHIPEAEWSFTSSMSIMWFTRSFVLLHSSR